MQKAVDDRGAGSTPDTPPAPKRGLEWVIVPVLVFAALVGLFAFALTTGDPSRLPSALIGKPAPATDFPAACRAHRRHPGGAGILKRAARQRQGERRKFLGVVVRGVRSGAGLARGARGQDRRAALRRQLQGRGDGRAPLPRPLRQPVRGGGHRRQRAQRHRVGRLRHAGDVRRQRQGRDRVQARRRGHARIADGEADPRDRGARKPPAGKS